MLKRSEVTEWTRCSEIGDQPYSAIHANKLDPTGSGDRATVNMKMLLDPASPPKAANGTPLPGAAYEEDLNVYDCTTPMIGSVRTINFQRLQVNSFTIIKWGLPQYLHLSIELIPGFRWLHILRGNALSANENLSTPLVSKEQIAAMKFNSLASTPSGDGDIFYGRSQSTPDAQNEKAALFILRLNKDRNVKDFFPQGTSIPDHFAQLSYGGGRGRVTLKCDDNKDLIDRTEFWNSSNELVRAGSLSLWNFDIKFSEFPGVFEKTFRNPAPEEILCAKPYGGLGIRLAQR